MKTLKATPGDRGQTLVFHLVQQTSAVLLLLCLLARYKCHRRASILSGKRHVIICENHHGYQQLAGLFVKRARISMI